MENQEPGTTDRVDMTLGTLGSLVLNTGYLLLVHADQRMLLMLFVSAIVGIVLLATATKGAVGMGIIMGAGASIAVSLTVLAIHGSIVPK